MQRPGLPNFQKEPAQSFANIATVRLKLLRGCHSDYAPEIEGKFYGAENPSNFENVLLSFQAFEIKPDIEIGVLEAIIDRRTEINSMISRGVIQETNQGEEWMGNDRIAPVIDKEALYVGEDVVVVKIAMFKRFRNFEFSQGAA